MARRCLADISGPFYDPAKPFRNWSALPFYQLDLMQPPYVDCDQLVWGIKRAETYLAHIHAQGYTGIVIDNLAHLVGFEHTPVQIYAPDSPYRQRAAIYREAFGRLFDTAARLGMEVFVTTDMQWSTPPVRSYVGRLAVNNPRLADINRWALEELFVRLPQICGLFVRVGETGGAHDQGRHYAGHMLYTAPTALQRLIGTLLPVCERHDRMLVMRTWSIGIGELGDLSWSRERYMETFAGYRSPYLLVSIKHGPSDFFRLLPHNPTLGLPGPAQIIELQNRREYELFGMTPSAVVPLHQDVLQHAVATNPRFAGVWAWNSSGGWGGGQAALGSAGWSVWTELSSALTAALVQTPDLDAPVFVQRWCVNRFGPSLGPAVADVYRESASLIERGWYLGRLARSEQTLGAIYVPSLLWVWWMRPTAALVIWAYLAAAVASSADVLRAGTAACACVAGHLERLAVLAPVGDRDAATVVESVRYLHDVLTVAQAIRMLMLQLLEAAWAAERPRWEALVGEAATVRTQIATHRATWENRADLPPLELDEVDIFLDRLECRPGLIWWRARAACLLIDRLRAGHEVNHHIRTRGMIAAALLTFFLIFQGHPRVGIAGALAAVVFVTPLRQRAIRVVLPRLSRRFNVLPSIFFETGPSFTEWTA